MALELIEYTRWCKLHMQVSVSYCQSICASWGYQLSRKSKYSSCIHARSPARGRISWFFRWSYGLTAGDADLTVFEKIIFFNFRYIWLILGRCGPKQADFMGGYNLSSLTRLKVNLLKCHFVNWDLLKVKFSPLCKHQLTVGTLSLTAN